MGEGPSAGETCLGALAGGLYGLAVRLCLVPSRCHDGPGLAPLLDLLRTGPFVGNAPPLMELGGPLVPGHACVWQTPVWSCIKPFSASHVPLSSHFEDCT